jgi:hypothetical protein
MRRRSVRSEFRESQKAVAETRRLSLYDASPSPVQKAKSPKVLNPVTKLDEGLAQ